MKKDELDELIRKMLDQDDQQLIEELAVTGPMEKIVRSFRSRVKFLNAMVLIMMFAFAALAVFCAIKYFDSESVKASLGWAVGFVGSWTTIGFLKLYQFMDIDRNLILRELKKIEYKLASGVYRE